MGYLAKNVCLFWEESGGTITFFRREQVKLRKWFNLESPVRGGIFIARIVIACPKF